MSSLWKIYRALEEASLVRILPDYKVYDGPTIWLVYPKSNVLAAKERVVIAFLLETGSVAPKTQ